MKTEITKIGQLEARLHVKLSEPEYAELLRKRGEEFSLVMAQKEEGTPTKFGVLHCTLRGDRKGVAVDLNGDISKYGDIAYYEVVRKAIKREVNA